MDKDLHLEILDDNRKEVFQKLSFFKDVGYLAGGTALALNIAHRVSYDFDVFCSKEISIKLGLLVKEKFSAKQILANSPDELSFLGGKDIKVSLVFYPFDLTEYVKEKRDAPLGILEPIGVALAKAYAIGRRNSWRDYLDLYVILETKTVGFGRIIEEAGKVYGDLFNEKLFLSQLLYTEDIPEKEVEETQLFGRKVSKKTVKDFFQNQIDRHVEKRF